MGGPKQVYFVPAAVCPIIEKVVHEKRQDPNGGLANVPTDGGDLVDHQRINDDRHQFDDGANGLADESNVQAGHGVVKTIDLLAHAPGCQKLDGDASQKKWNRVDDEAHVVRFLYSPVTDRAHWLRLYLVFSVKTWGLQ